VRTYGRIFALNPDGSRRVPQPAGFPQWAQVSTDANGFDDYVWLTTLLQCLKLGLGESPFWANYGIPARQSVAQQIAPDYYVARTQQQFASRFANLVVARESSQVPTYKINVTTHQGVKIATSVPA